MAPSTIHRFTVTNYHIGIRLSRGSRKNMPPRRRPCAERQFKVGEWRRQSERRPQSSKGGDLTKLADAAAQTAARSGSSWGILRVKLGYAVVTAVATVEGRPWRWWRDGRGDGGGTAVATAEGRPWRRRRDGRDDGRGTAVTTTCLRFGGGLRQLGEPNVPVWRVLPPNLKCAARSVAVGHRSA